MNVETLQREGVSVFTHAHRDVMAKTRGECTKGHSPSAYVREEACQRGLRHTPGHTCELPSPVFPSLYFEQKHFI